jgi:hypothetical protein
MKARLRHISARSRLGLGVLFLLVAVVCFGVATLLSSNQRHAYNRRATPPPIYHLTLGKQYQLSSPTGVAGLQKAGVLATSTPLSCTVSRSGESPVTLPIVNTHDDVRDLHLFATAQAPATGAFHVACAGVDEVFVDDADDSPRDWVGVLVIFSVLFGVLGIAAGLSGGYQLSRPRAVTAMSEG